MYPEMRSIFYNGNMIRWISDSTDSTVCAGSTISKGNRNVGSGGYWTGRSGTNGGSSVSSRTPLSYYCVQCARSNGVPGLITNTGVIRARSGLRT